MAEPVLGYASILRLWQAAILYCARFKIVNFNDKILSPGNCLERDAISLTASEREGSCQGSKDVEKKFTRLSWAQYNCG